MSGSIIGGIVVTLVTGLIPNIPSMLLYATHYGLPLVWLIRLVIAPEYLARARLSIVATVSLDQTSNYEVVLSPGRYIVDINKIGIDRSAQVPTEITIEPGKTIKLDIQIDTCIS